MKNLLHALVVVFVTTFVLAACAQLPGVNVGASIPIGGIGSVGASTTVGDGPRTPKTNPPAGPQGAPETESDSDTDDDSDAEAD